MPKVLVDFLGYQFYFWANENDEPPHVHVSKGAPTVNATKFWITDDGIKLEHNNGQIPSKDLKKISRYILTNKEVILFAWFRYFKKL